MALQGFTIIAFTVGLASLLYYFLANNGRQEQTYGYRNSGGRNGPDMGTSYNFTTAGSSSSNNEQRNQYRKRRSKKIPFKDICAICLLNVSNQDKMLDCGHCFHDKCIQTWRTYGPEESRETCPNCREAYQNI